MVVVRCRSKVRALLAMGRTIVDAEESRVLAVNVKLPSVGILH